LTTVPTNDFAAGIMGLHPLRSGCAACCAQRRRTKQVYPPKQKFPCEYFLQVFPNLRECHSQPWRVAGTERFHRFEAQGEGQFPDNKSPAMVPLGVFFTPQLNRHNR
jgi:hypothetical protein